LRKIRTSSRPLPVPSNLQGWGTFNTLGQGVTPGPDTDWGKFLADRQNPTGTTHPRRSDQLNAAGIAPGGASGTGPGGEGGEGVEPTAARRAGGHSAPPKKE